MKHLILLALATILTACDITSAPDDLADAYSSSTSALGRKFCAHLVQWPDSVIEVSDSLSRWPYSDSGTYQVVLIRTEWTGKGTCDIEVDPATGESSILGGIDGIRRYFGRWRNPPANPNYQAPVKCVDCGWGK